MMQFLYVVLALGLTAIVGGAGIGYISSDTMMREKASGRLAAELQQLAAAYDGHVNQVPGPPSSDHWARDLKPYGLTQVPSNSDGFTWSFQRVPGGWDWFCASLPEVSDGMIQSLERLQGKIPNRFVVISTACGAGASSDLSVAGRAGLVGGPIAATIRMGDFSAVAATSADDRAPISDTLGSGFDFSVPPKTELELASMTVSDNVWISDLPDGSYVSVSGSGTPQISIDGNAWSSRGTIDNGDRLQVRMLSASTFSTPRTAQVTIGSVSRPFVATTRDPDLDPNSFSFAQIDERDPGAETTSAAASISGLEPDYDVPVSVALASGSSLGTPRIRVNGGPWTGATTIRNGQSVEDLVNASNDYSTAGDAVVTIGDRNAAFRVTTRDADITPDDFAFANQTGGSSAWVESNTVTITGIEIPVTVSVGNGGQMSIDNEPWSSKTSDTIASGQTLKVRLQASPSGNQTVTAQVSVGTLTRSYNLTTTPDTSPNNFSFSTVGGAERSTWTSSNWVTITGINAPTSVSISSGGQFTDASGNWTSTSSRTISNGQSIAVRVRSSGSYSSNVSVSLNVGGVVRSFTVRTKDNPIYYASQGQLASTTSSRVNRGFSQADSTNCVHKSSGQFVHSAPFSMPSNTYYYPNGAGTCTIIASAPDPGNPTMEYRFVYTYRR